MVPDYQKANDAYILLCAIAFFIPAFIMSIAYWLEYFIKGTKNKGTILIKFFYILSGITFSIYLVKFLNY